MRGPQRRRQTGQNPAEDGGRKDEPNTLTLRPKSAIRTSTSAVPGEMPARIACNPNRANKSPKVLPQERGRCSR